MYRILGTRLIIRLSQVGERASYATCLSPAACATSSRKHLGVFSTDTPQRLPTKTVSPGTRLVGSAQLARGYASGRDLMKGWNPTGENPADRQHDEDDSDVEPDNTVKVYMTQETRSDELVVLMDGLPTTLPIQGLYTQIRSMNFEQVISMVANSATLLDKLDNAIPFAMRRLYFVSKKMDKDELSYIRSNIAKDDEFKILCAMVAKQGPDLEPDKAMDMLEYLHHFGLESDHPAVRVYLQLSMSFMNDLYLDQMAALASIVYSMKTTKVTTLLREGLKVVAKNFFPKDIPGLNMRDKVTLLSLLGEHMEGQFKENLLQAIEDEIYDLKLASAIKLLSAQHKLNLKNKVLQEESMDKIVPHIDILNVNDAKLIVEALTGLGLFVPDFLKGLGSRACGVNSEWSTEDIALLATYYRKQGYSHTDVLSHLAQNAGQGVMSFDRHLEILQYVSDCRYDTSNNQAVSRISEKMTADVNAETSIASLVEIGLAHQLYELPITGSSAALLKSITTLEDQDDGKSRLGLADKLLALSSYVNDSELSRIASISARSSWRPESSLTGALNHITENMGSLKVQHGVHSETGHYVDHMISVAGQPDGQASTAVLCLPGGCFLRNTGQLKGGTYLVCRAIQEEGLNVLVFNEASWKLIKEDEKLDFLLNKVKDVDKYQDLEMLGMDNIAQY